MECEPKKGHFFLAHGSIHVVPIPIEHLTPRISWSISICKIKLYISFPVEFSAAYSGSVGSFTGYAGRNPDVQT